MKPGYPMLARKVLRSLPLDVEITGRKGRAVLAVLDKCFDATKGERSVSVCGMELHVDLSKPSERLLYYVPDLLIRRYSRSPLYRVIQCVSAEQGGTFVDIGANLGLYSLLARLQGLDTVCFEPEPAHYAFLRRNERVVGRTFAKALSNSGGSAVFYISGPQNPGASSLVSATSDLRSSGYVATVEVRVSSLDEEIRAGEVEAERIRLIKIDVEGNEGRTIEGMRSYLGRADAAPVWVEVRGPGSERGENNYLGIVEVMREFSFAPFRAEGRSFRPFVIREAIPQVFDLLFLNLEHHGRLWTELRSRL